MRRLYQRIEGSVFRRVRGRLLARGVEATDEFSRHDALVVAPHPDDETLGCGCAILRKLAAGRAVTVVIVTDGRMSHESARMPPDELARVRRGEAVEACARLGVTGDRVHFLDVPDTRSDEHEEQIAGRLAAIARSSGAAHVLSPSPLDAHTDHRTIGRVAARLVVEGRWPALVDEYPVWFWSLRAWSAPGASVMGRVLSGRRALAACDGLTPRLVSTRGLLDRKRHALAAHRTQCENVTGEPGWRTFPPEFLAQFFQDDEVFFALTLEAARARSASASRALSGVRA